MVVVYDHTVQEHHFVSSGTLMALTCDLLGTKIGETAQCEASMPAPRCMVEGGQLKKNRIKVLLRNAQTSVCGARSITDTPKMAQKEVTCPSLMLPRCLDAAKPRLSLDGFCQPRCLASTLPRC